MADPKIPPPPAGYALIPPPPAGYSIKKPVGIASAAPAEEPPAEGSDRQGFLERGGGDLVDAAKGIFHWAADKPEGTGEKVASYLGPGGLQLFRAIKGYYEGTKKTIGQAESAADKGDKTGVVINSAAAGLPVVGPLVSGVYEQSGKGDVSGDVGVATSRIAQVASMAPEGSVIPNPVNGMAKAGSATINAAKPVMAKVAPRLYQSALKPSTTMEPALRERAITTGLDANIPVSEKGFINLHSLIDDLNSRIKGIVGGTSKTVDPNKAASRVGSVRKRFAEQVNASDDLRTIDQTKQNFLDEQGAKPGKPAQPPSPTGVLDENGRPIMNAGSEATPAKPAPPMAAERAQSLKEGTYRQLKSRAYGELKSAQIEAEKALARGLKEELEVQFPEIKGLNAQESKFLGLEPLLARSLGRISNHEMLGIGTPIAAGGAAALTGSSKLGAIVGTMKAIIDNPAVKSRLAIAIHKASKGSVTLKGASARVTAYVDALAKAQEEKDAQE